MNFRILLTAIAAATTVVAAVAAPASSRLAEGRWIKVKVTSEGIQQISHRQLRQWGFDDPARVGVYGFGGTSLAHERISAGSDDLCPTPVIHTPDGRMLFYGDATCAMTCAASTPPTTTRKSAPWLGDATSTTTEAITS